MARGPRLDAPGALHHVMARGIERGAIFVDDADREDFVARLAQLAGIGAITVYAWALMPNHVHMLVRTGSSALERAMRTLLAGYATRFNRRHDRVGHLFQNRYKSTLCEDDAYFLKLVQYVHLNPVPAVVADVEALASYPYSVNSALLGLVQRPWQETDRVLEQFAPDPRAGRAMYDEFITRGAREEEVDGGGLVRGASGWRYVVRLRKGRERFSTDERITGGPGFVEQTLDEVGRESRARATRTTSSSSFAGRKGFERTTSTRPVAREPSARRGGASRSSGLSTTGVVAGPSLGSSASPPPPSTRPQGAEKPRPPSGSPSSGTFRNLTNLETSPSHFARGNIASIVCSASTSTRPRLLIPGS